MTQTDDVAEGVFGKSGNQKQDKGIQGAFFAHEAVEPLNQFRFDKFFDQGQAEEMGQAEGKPGTERQADGREESSFKKIFV